MSRSRPLVLALALCSIACHPGPTTSDGPNAASPVPPVAKKVPHELTAHGHTRIDPYYWLRDRGNPDVIAYLEAENDYTQAVTAEWAPLRRELVAELAGRLEPDDVTAPVEDRGFFYYQRWAADADHPVFCRKQGSLDAPEQVLLDGQALSAGHEFFAIDELETSESQDLLAYSVDTVGRRFYTIYVKDLRSGELLADEIPATGGAIEWAADDRMLYYVKQDPETLRHFQVLRHTLGERVDKDELVYEERDETFDVSLWRSKSRAYVLLHSGSTLSDEVQSRTRPATSSAARPSCATPTSR